MDDRHLIEQSLPDLLEEKFATYSKYIIQDRALPDARDGLKPVQRRILYAMHNLKIVFNSPTKKSARIVGEVIGKYHPHGDSSVYETIVRLSQDWKQNFPLIEMQGNKGSIDGDPAAAMRYTEIRLNKITNYLLENIQKDKVQFTSNFDDSEKEPVVLPGHFPNLLVNGAIGIAAGFSTNIPPHNLSEIINLICARIEDTSLPFEEAIEKGIIKGPDFPTGGTIIGTKGINDAFATGKGKITIRSKFEYDYDNNRVIVTEIPFEINKSELIRKLDLLITEKNLTKIKSIQDETDKNGIRIVITFNPEETKKSEINENEKIEIENKKRYIEKGFNYLLVNSDLQHSFPVNMVAISNRRPQQMNLMELIDAFINHQKITFRNQFKYDLKKTEDRLEIVEGLIKVVSIIDKVIATIRHSKDKQDAKQNIVNKFNFTNNQAEAIVVLRLYRLTSTDIVILKDEHKQLLFDRNHLKLLLNRNSELNQYIINYLLTLKQEFEVERKTNIIEEENSLEINEEEEMISSVDYAISISRLGTVRVLNSNKEEDYQIIPTNNNDLIINKFVTKNKNRLIFFTTKGNYLVLPITKIQISKPTDVGININKYASLEKDETVIAAFPVESFENDLKLVIATNLGMIKRIAFDNLKQSKIIKLNHYITLAKNDSVVGIKINYFQSQEIGCISEIGYGFRFNMTEIPILSLKAKGVRAINLKGDDTLAVIEDNDLEQIFLLSKEGFGKIIKFNELSNSKRPSRGKLVVNQTKKPVRIKFGFSIKNRNREVIYFQTKMGIEEFNLSKILTSTFVTRFSNLIKTQNTIFDLKNNNLFGLDHFIKKAAIRLNTRKTKQKYNISSIPNYDTKQISLPMIDSLQKKQPDELLDETTLAFKFANLEIKKLIKDEFKKIKIGTKKIDLNNYEETESRILEIENRIKELKDQNQINTQEINIEMFEKTIEEDNPIVDEEINIEILENSLEDENQTSIEFQEDIIDEN